MPAVTSATGKKHSRTSGSAARIGGHVFFAGGNEQNVAAVAGIFAAFGVHRALARQDVDAFFEIAVHMRTALLVAGLRRRDCRNPETDARADLAGDRLKRSRPGKPRRFASACFSSLAIRSPAANA